MPQSSLAAAWNGGHGWRWARDFTANESAFVPVESMPGWMEAFARNQPLNQIVNATRAFSLGDKAEAVPGHPAGYFAVRSLI